MGTRRATWLLAALLVALTVLAYLPAIQGGWIWDDDSYVTGDPRLLDLQGLFDIWFRPVATYGTSGTR
jgi:hypothetical protein